MVLLAPPVSGTLAAPPGTIGPSPDRDAIQIELVEDTAALGGHEPAWQQLADHALEPNAFAEPWMFRPAWQAFHERLPLLLAFAYRQEVKGRALVGVFPLEHRRHYRGLPVSLLRLWTHKHGVLGTPLLHHDQARETLSAFFAWARQHAALVHMPMVHGEGPFHQALADVVNEQRLLTFVEETFTRALWERGADAETYLADALSSGTRKELRRQRKRLGEVGRLESRRLSADEDCTRWIEQFLALETAGWKGREQTALGFTAEERAFFQTVAHAAHARRRLHMLGLFLDGRAIALKCNFLMPPGAVAFKIAYDESFAKYSPGVQLELDNISACHDLAGLEWMDSCAIARHSMINRLWRERRTMQTVLISTGRRLGHLAAGILPLLRALKRLCRG